MEIVNESLFNVTIYIPTKLPLVRTATIAQSVQRRATGCMTGFQFPAGARDLTLQHPDRTWGLPSLSNAHQGLFPRGQSGRGVKLTTPLHLVDQQTVADRLFSPLKYGTMAHRALRTEYVVSWYFIFNDAISIKTKLPFVQSCNIVIFPLMYKMAARANWILFNRT
jgi:hypothetical protein